MKIIRNLVVVTAVLGVSSSFAAQSYTDAAGDIDPGISNGSGTLDLIGAEVSHTSTDLIFKLNVNGNVSTTDWGKFLIGISTGKTAGTTSGNGWGRPISMTSPVGGMDFWIGSWVDGGGGSQLWNYSGSAWSGPGALASFSFTSGVTSQLSFTVSRAALGLTGSDTFYFDAYSSGGGGSDSAIDALANPNVTITTWGGSYNSNTSNGLISYAIPEPSAQSLILLGFSALLVIGASKKKALKNDSL